MRDSFMARAIAQAEAAALMGEVPVGAVVTDRAGRLVAEAHNLTLHLKDPTAHAEILALRAAAKSIGSERLTDCDLWVSLEPCTMCAGAISFARIRRLYYGAEDPKGGAVDNGVRFFNQSTCHHAPEVYGGIDALRAGSVLTEFFAARRHSNSED